MSSTIDVRKIVQRVQFPSLKAILFTVLDQIDRLTAEVKRLGDRLDALPEAPKRVDETRLEALEQELRDQQSLLLHYDERLRYVESASNVEEESVLETLTEGETEDANA